MKTVWKFPLTVLPAGDDICIKMPKGADVLSFGVQYDFPVLWALVDPTATLVSRYFRIVDTGHDIEDPSNFEFVGTAMLRGGALVFHLFQDLRALPSQQSEEGTPT